MKTVGIKIIGRKTIKKKDGNIIFKHFYISEGFEKDVEGNQAGELWRDDPLDLDENYNAVLGYDRAGKYGVVDILD